MNMLKQLNDAIAYMERNLCGELDYGEAARIACVTEDSFKRFFSYMTGMSVNEYIRRRRLTLAAYEVQETDARIIDIAVKYHYESTDAFTTERGGYAGDVLPRLRDLIFNSWLPDSGYRQSADLEIEIYHLWTKREERREKRYFEIWVPIA